MDKVSLLLKAFVIGSGVLLVIGTITLAVLLVLGIAGDAPQETVAVQAPPRESVVRLPEGARIDQVVPDPVRDRILLLGTAGDGSPFLALVDPGEGRLLGTIRFRPEPTP